MESRPLLPVEEEGRLNDPDLRENFIERVFVYSRWRDLTAGDVRARDLVEFHTAHKFLVMAHDQEAMRSLGRLVAEAADDPQAAAGEYFPLLMQAMKKPARRGNQVNVLQHIAGFFKDELDNDDRRELHDAIEHYGAGELPIIAPLTLIRHHLRRRPDYFLDNQRFLEQRPAALDTRRR